uniref:Uncharacterized protein n=1 Tax=Coprothermobacter proteolyticus (strain ATCC 35245 / DSM 5265 / OCM 4 / BT) TaxID=309798 RepID=B5Y6F3_COPPD
MAARQAYRQTVTQCLVVFFITIFVVLGGRL